MNEYNKYRKEYSKLPKCKQYHIIYNKQYKINNPELKIYVKKYLKQYNIKNKVRLEKLHISYRKIRSKSDISFKLLLNLRSRIWIALNGIAKSKKTIKLLNCSILELKNYLESKFKRGMSWKNYGKWEVDHIKPCSSFDLSKPKEQRKCFNYKNLQPLWAKDNRKKGALCQRELQNI